MGKGIIKGKNVKLGSAVKIWNYVVIGDNVEIGSGTTIGSFCDIGKNVMIGKNCNIQAHVTISNGCRVGNRVFIAPNTSLLNDKYPLSESLMPITIADGAIIGGGVTLLPGIIVRPFAVVGAGSVVTREVPAKTVVAGVPAKKIMTLNEYESKRKKLPKKQQ